MIIKIVKFEITLKFLFYWEIGGEIISYKENKINERINSIGRTKQGDYIKVIDYKGANDITVEFIDDFHHTVKTRWSEFESGNLKNPYRASVYGVGISGTKYPITDINNKRTFEYLMWNDILKRCYGHEFDIKNINYKQCIVSHEWLFYENFYEWLHSQSNFENIKRLNHSAIDKDIIEKHNKIYSDKYCCLVPDYVNNLFTRRERERGDLPIGVSYHPKNKKLYIAGLSKFGKRCHIGVYDNEVEAFLAYKEEKEKYIKEIANYAFASEGITEKCYEAMLNYKVEITD